MGKLLTFAELRKIKERGYSEQQLRVYLSDNQMSLDEAIINRIYSLPVSAPPEVIVSTIDDTVTSGSVILPEATENTEETLTGDVLAITDTPIPVASQSDVLVTSSAKTPTKMKRQQVSRASRELPSKQDAEQTSTGKAKQTKKKVK